MLSQIIQVILYLCGQGNLITIVWKVSKFLLSDRVGTLYKSQHEFLLVCNRKNASSVIINNCFCP